MIMKFLKRWPDLNLILKNCSLIKRFIVTYIIILVIPLILTGIFIFSSVTGIVSKEIQSTTLNNIFQTRDIIDMRVRELNNAAANLLQNPVILPLITTQDYGNIREYDYYSLMRELRNYRNTNALFDDIYIYFRNSDTIISSVGKLRLSQFYYQAFKYQRNWNEFKNILDTVSETSIMPVETVYVDNAPKQILTYLMPIPKNEINYRATLMITVDASSIDKIVRNVLGDNRGEVRVIDEKGQLIALAENEISLTVDDMKSLLLQGDRVAEKVINGKTQMVFYSNSLQTGWKYIAVLPSSQIMIIVNRIKRLSILILAICVLIGGCMIYYFSYWNFDPIKQVFETASKYEKTTQIQPPSHNELDVIEMIMKSTIAENIDLEKRLREQSPVIRADFLRNLLKGTYDDIDYVNRMCEFCNLKLLRGPFAVMMFGIDDYDEFAEIDSKSPQKLLKFSLTNIVEGFTQNVGNGYAVGVSDRNVALLIDFSNNDHNLIEQMRMIGENTIGFFENSFDLTLTVGIGRVYNKTMDIVKSYVEAVTASEYKMIMGGNKVILYENIETTKCDRLYYPLRSESTIFDALKNGDYNIIQEVLATTIDKIRKTPLDINVVRCIYFEIVNTAMKALNKFELEDYTEIILQENILLGLLHCETLDGLYEKVVNFYRIICERIQSTKNIKRSNFENNIIQYIEENYRDMNLSLTQMAAKFGVTPTYLSRFFKKRAQYNFVEYVHRLRIKNAKELLEDTNMNINDIAIEVGYADSHSLIRAFKKYENITPGRFREAMVQ